MKSGVNLHDDELGYAAAKRYPQHRSENEANQKGSERWNLSAGEANSLPPRRAHQLPGLPAKERESTGTSAWPKVPGENLQI